MYEPKPEELSLADKQRQTNFLVETAYCDYKTPNILDATNLLIKSCRTEAEVAQRLFYWVQNNIKYVLGLYKHSASETLIKGHGSCTNKANLLIAMLRAAGISAGYHIMQVKTRLYFGSHCPARILRFASEKSLHIYSGALIDGRWLKCDATDDLELCDGAAHLAMQATPVRFDGSNDAQIKLDKAHIISDSPAPVADIDFIFEKKIRLSEVAQNVMNHFVQFLRIFGAFYQDARSLEAGFFNWLRLNHPHTLNLFLVEELKLERELTSQADHARGLKSEYM